MPGEETFTKERIAEEIQEEYRGNLLNIRGWFHDQLVDPVEEPYVQERLGWLHYLDGCNTQLKELCNRLNLDVNFFDFPLFAERIETALIDKKLGHPYELDLISKPREYLYTNHDIKIFLEQLLEVVNEKIDGINDELFKKTE